MSQFEKFSVGGPVKQLKEGECTLKGFDSGSALARIVHKDGDAHLMVQGNDPEAVDKLHSNLRVLGLLKKEQGTVRNKK